MKRVFLIGFASLAVLASMSSAAVFVDVLNQGTPVSGATTMTGWTGFVVRLTSDTGNITAVDFSGAKAFTGPMAQRWTSGEGDGNYDTASPGFSTAKNVATTTGNFDSHFLGSAVNFVVGSALNENATFPNGNPLTSTDTAGYGAGTLLAGAYGVAGAAQTTVLEVAYIVVQNGQSVSFTNAPIATANGTFNVSGVVAIPEPATLGLLGLAAMGIGRRRR